MAFGPQPKNTREEILEATRTVLTQVGYENITTRRIAEAAHVNIATLHYYFGNKEALLTEALNYALQQTIAHLKAAAQQAMQEGGTESAIAATFEVTWQRVKERRSILRYDVAVRGLRDDAARREANALYGAFRQLNEDILRHHVETGGHLAHGVSLSDLAFYLVAATDGVLLQHALTGDDEAAQRGLQLIQQHAFSLLRTGEEPKTNHE